MPVDSILMSFLSSGRPSSGDGFEWLWVEEVELGAATSLGRHEAGVLEHGQMLGDRLAGRADAMMHGERRTDLEQALTVPGRPC